MDAWQAVRQARVTLMLRHPYLAAAVARLPLVDASNCLWCPTCATDGYAIYVNPAFTATLGDDELVFVMAHELVHCVLGHLDRVGRRDRFIWNVAVDYATNALLVAHGHVAPSAALLHPRFGNLTAEQIYDDLIDQLHADHRRNGNDIRRDADGLPVWDGIQVTTAGGSVRRVEASAAGFQVGTDAHLPDQGAAAGGLRPDPFPTLDERNSVRRALIEACADAAGAEAGRWTSEVKSATATPMAWQSMLANFVSGLRRSDYRLFPPNRRYVHRGLFLPSLGVPGPEHLVVAVDTSASMSAILLSQVLSQIDHLRAATECEVTLLQFDVRVHSCISIDPCEPISTAELLRNEVHGRGGTDLRAPFTYVAADDAGRFQSMDALIVMTDGDGPVSDRPPPYPVLWIITPGGKNGSSFGWEVALPSDGGMGAT